MPTFISDGVTLAYDDIAPPGPPERTVILIHGYTSNRKEGWRRTGWYAALERRGMRMVALDQRGHGESGKLYDPEAYARDRMGGDVLALMDHLGIGRCDLFGFSMGVRTALEVALQAPQRVSNLILGGVGGRMLEPRDPAAFGVPMAQAMLAEDVQAIPNAMMRNFRRFADIQGEDTRALAACSQAPSAPFDTEAMGRLSTPVLVVAGERDEGAGDPEDLARMFPQGRGVVIPGCDHFSIIPHALLKATVFDFLDGMLDDPFPNPYER